jgi:hypothetical protein
MPHSASGIYSEYYAIKYPDEVSSIIMLDTTSSAIKEANVPKFVYKLSKVQQATGFSRIINSFVVPNLLKESNGYTRQEIKEYSRFINHLFNDTIIDQNVRFNDNIIEVMGMDFPDAVSVLKIVPTGTIKQVKEEYQMDHINRLGVNAKYIIIDGSHFIYHTNITDIYDATIDFLYKR